MVRGVVVGAYTRADAPARVACAPGRGRPPRTPMARSSRALGGVQPVEDPIRELAGESRQRRDLSGCGGPHARERTETLQQNAPACRANARNAQQLRRDGALRAA